MTEDYAIQIKNLSKTFKIREQKIENIREYLYSIFKFNQKFKILKALKNVNLNINKGEFFGIIGKNGSGKSTLLKILMQSYQPDFGATVIINGSMMRLALGIGFDQNLSARDNIYVNGSIIGLTFKEIGTQFNRIIEFAELEEFVDTPIKFFSSGMKSRLAFSVAVMTRAEILLIDEFFGGVGDIEFKNKSEKVFLNTFLDGRTIIFVSHDLNKIIKYAHRVAVMDKGKIVYLGAPDKAVDFYKAH